MEDTKPIDAKLSDSLARAALKKIRALCQGNGINTDDVKLGPFEGLLYTVHARLMIFLKSAVGERRMNGKQHGELLPNRIELSKKIHNYTVGAANDATIQQTIRDIILQRPDKGFGFGSKTDITLEKFQESYVLHEDCQTCSGNGRSLCPQCRGQGQELCVRCQGRTLIMCDLCRGNGKIQGPNGQQNCTRCFGRQQIQCPLCRATGKTQCRQCGANGKIPCNMCGATGCHSIITTVTLTANGEWQYDREAVPKETRILFDRQAARLAEKKMLDIIPEDKLDKDEKGLLMLGYRFKFPYGPITFLLKDKPLRGWLFGYQSKLMSIPDFLEDMVRPGVKDLEEAASGNGNIAGKLKKAGQFKLLALTVLTAAKHTAAKTAQIISSKYPIGVSVRFVQSVSQMADDATRHITRMPRYIGLGIGLLVTAGIFTFYFLGHGRTMITQYIPIDTLKIALDALLLLIGGSLPVLNSQLLASKAVYDSLGHLLPANQRKGLMPKAGKVVYWAYLGSAILFFLIIYIAGDDRPEWIRIIIERLK